MLTASEPGIYGRFGYGVGSWMLSLDIDTVQVRFQSP